MPFEAIWENIVRCSGQKFFNKTGLPFTYQIIDDSVITSRTNYSLSKEQFKKAAEISYLIGPGQINHLVRGPAYIYAILADSRIRP